MKKTLILFAAIATMFASCNKQELVPGGKSVNDIKLNITVSGLEDNSSSTKAMVKTGWENGDIISIWYDSNIQAAPDLVIKYNGTTWENDSEATLSGNTPEANGNLKAVYNGAVLVAAKDNYSYEGSTLSSSISTWTYLSEIQVVLTGLSSSDAANYTLSCNRITSLASGKFTVGEAAITAASGVKGGAVTGIANGDGVAFVFATTDAYGSEADYKFYLAETSGTTVVSRKSFTASAKTLTNVSDKIMGIKIDASKFANITATNLSEAASANTYIVSAAGTYCFDATIKGNGGFDPMTGTTATRTEGIVGVKVLWELYSQGRAINYADPVYDIFYSGDYVFFSTPDTFVSGDACVAVVDNENNILWSWLIWATPAPGTMEYNTKTFMDRNLGAIDAGNCMRGFLYQWGRKDAFSAANGNVYEPYSYVPGYSTVFSYGTGPKTMGEAIANPTAVYKRQDSSNHSWMDATAYNAMPWRDDLKTIYDPCPIGWRVPVKGDLNGYTGFPATGVLDLDGGGFGNPGTGYCWYSTRYDDNVQRGYAFFNDDRKNSPQNGGQDQCYAIRPVKDITSEAVDLGLPSGTLWATCNVGASKPEDYGKYYAWGETTAYGETDASNPNLTGTKTYFNWVDYKHCVSGNDFKINKYNTDAYYGYVDGKAVLEPQDDAASVNWGRSWRMPTDVEIAELIDPTITTCEDTTLGGINGLLITSKINGKSIFLPKAGWHYDGAYGEVGSTYYYWSNTLFTSHTQCAFRLRSSDGLYKDGRIIGGSIRPVMVSD